MASNLKSTTLYSNNSKAYYLQAYFNEESTNTPQNSSRIYVEAKLTSTGYRWTSSYDSYLRIYWHDNRENYDRLVATTTLKEIANSGSVYASGYIDPLYHNGDGGLSGYAYATFTKGGTSSYTPNTGGVTTDWTPLTTIPRQANITGYNDFNDEQNPTITFNNPGGFRINARLEFAGTDINKTNIPNTGSYTFSLTDDERKLLRQKCTGNSMIVRGVIATCIGGTTENYWSFWDKTMTIVNGNPTFDNFNFADVNEKTVALTGSNTSIIKGYSNVKVTIPSSMKATANKEATLSKYRASIGTANPTDITYSSDGDVDGTVYNADSSTINVYAIDSRNNSKLVSKQVTNFISYEKVTKGNISVTRTNGVSEDVTLKINGTFNKIDFGEVVNSIKYSKYRYRVKGTSEWSDYKDLSLTTSGNNFAYDGLIKGDTETLGFDIGNSYEIEVLVKDELSEVTFSEILGSGIPNIALHKNGVGIMGAYDEEVGGDLQIRGKNPFDSDWTDLTLKPNVNANIAKYKKIGNMVNIIITNLTGYEFQQTFVTLPEEIRPTYGFRCICPSTLTSYVRLEVYSKDGNPGSGTTYPDKKGAMHIQNSSSGNKEWTDINITYFI
jgi:hypothetical protein